MPFKNGDPPGPGRDKAKDLPAPLASRLRELYEAESPELNATLALLKQLTWPMISMSRAMGVQHSSIASRLASAAARHPLGSPSDPYHPLAGLTEHLLPPWALTQEEVDRLRALATIADQATFTPHGSAARVASLELSGLMQRLHERGVTPAHLSRASGLPRHLIASRLKRLDALQAADAAPWGVNPAGTPENIRPSDVQRRKTPPATTTSRSINSSTNRSKKGSR